MTIEEISQMTSEEFQRFCRDSEDEAGRFALELESRIVSLIEETDGEAGLRTLAVALAESMDIMTSIEAISRLQDEGFEI